MNAISPEEASVRKSLTVKAPLERCFKVFTDGFGTWWPGTHHIAKVEMKDCFIERRAGGRWYERGVDGSECDWGRVLAWEPPNRLVLSWHLGSDWQYHAETWSEVEVTFVAEGPRATRVELVHRHLDRHGEGWRELAKGVSGEGGWSSLLGLFGAAAEKAA